MIKITQINLGFPVNQTLEYSIDDIEQIKKMDFTNKNIHLKLSLDKLLKKNFNQSVLEQEIMNSTHASKVKVSFIYNQETNIRSKEVTDQTNITDKFISYADINQIKYSDSLIEKLHVIQNNMLLQSFIPHETFTLEYISLRGAIGIMDGQHLEEMSFNFADDFEDGIIGIIGRAGSGKTTLLENMHPYPCMLTRTGTLKEHFCLKDSHRYLIYRSSSGIKYKIKMEISGTAKNVDTTYYVEKQEAGKSWEPITSLDSHKDSYLKWVESTFGPKELFLRTAFYTNANIKGLPDLAQAGKTEKMELFSILAGTDYLSVVCDEAKESIKSENKIIDDIKSQLKDYDNLDQRQSDNEKLIKDNKALTEELNKYLETDYKELAEYKEKQKLFDNAAATYSIYQTQVKEKNHEILEYEKQITQSENNIMGYEQQLENADLYKQQLDWYDENMKKRKELVTKESDLHTKFYSLQATLDNKERAYYKIRDEGISLKNELNNNKIEINRLTKSIPDLNGKCPVCGAPLESHKKEQLKQEAEQIKAQINSLELQNDNLEQKIKSSDNWLKENSLQNYKSELSDLNNVLIEISNDITAIDNYADTLDINEIKNVLTNTQGLLDTEKDKLSKITEKKESIEFEVKDLKAKLHNIPEDYTDKINRLERGIDDSKSKIAQAYAEITMAEKELERISGAAEKVKDIKAQIKEHQNNIKDFEIIQQAFSNNGIQALELDSAAPEISQIANAILYETYGDRFTISFDTQRDTKDGRKIDDFIINVFDADNARLKRLDLISSGEGTLIKQTLYYAFSVIRARRTGFCFKTRFLDESDSALDSELRVKYLRMIEAAHKQCGATQTFIITHSQELKDIISQKIEL